MNIIDILINFLDNPVYYSIIFLIYVILAAIILPIPVEIGLFNPNMNPIILVSILAIGKGVGSLIVFEIGLRLRKGIKNRFTGTALTKKIVKYCEIFVKNYGYIGLLIIMSIPLMIDSATLYLFSILNSKKKEDRRAMVRSRFVLINCLAGAIRGSIILLLAYYIGFKLV